MFQGTLAREGLAAFRMSEKAGGALPLRLVRSADINPYLQALDRQPLVPGTVVFSRTLAARHGVRPRDALMILADGVMHRFEVIDVADDIGFFAENGPYVDLKSYALFSDGNPLFAVMPWCVRSTVPGRRTKSSSVRWASSTPIPGKGTGRGRGSSVRSIAIF